MNKLRIRESKVFELLKQGKNYTQIMNVTKLTRGQVKLSIEKLRARKAVGPCKLSGKFDVDQEFVYEIEPEPPVRDKVGVTVLPQHHALITGVPPELIDNVLRQYAEHPNQRNKIAKDNNVSKLIVNAILLDRGVGS